MASMLESSLPRRFYPRSMAIGIVLAAIAGFAAPAPVAHATVQTRNPEDLLIVDCLLPGQVRKLGRSATFMGARRPIRTTQADCEIRGGEYVSYDRANYQTALKVWLGQAEAGDADAQNYVGEIYLKGLGTEPDYGKASEWFEQAAARGARASTSAISTSRVWAWTATWPGRSISTARRRGSTTTSWCSPRP